MYSYCIYSTRGDHPLVFTPVKIEGVALLNLLDNAKNEKCMQGYFFLNVGCNLKFLEHIHTFAVKGGGNWKLGKSF